MYWKKILPIAFALAAMYSFSGPAAADDCIRSCTAKLFVRLTYKPAGQSNIEKKTSLLQTTESLSRDGRAGNNCLPHNILKAKKRGCTEAVRDLVRKHHSGARQMAAVCKAVEYSKTLIPRSTVQDEIFPEAAWYQIDHMEAKGSRDRVHIRSEVGNIDHRKFRCEDGDATILQTVVRPRPAAAPGAAAPPPPPTVRRQPPPPANTTAPAPPPPPTAVSKPAVDLVITDLKLTPSRPSQGQPVEVRLSIYNKGKRAAGPFKVKWWPGENYPEPACSWSLGKMNAKGGRVLTCRYTGYPSWYHQLITKAAIDPDNVVPEMKENNNSRKMKIQVLKP